MRTAADRLQTATKASFPIDDPSWDTPPTGMSDAREERLELLLKLGLFLLAFQTFLIFYLWVWLHFPCILGHQKKFIAKLFEDLTLGLFESPSMVTGVVKMTEAIASHPKNLETISKAAQMVISSDVFMTSTRRVLKHIMLDKDIQRIVGVSMAGISKEAMKSTFSWNPNEAEEARQALLRGTDEPGLDDESMTSPGPREPTSPELSHRPKEADTSRDRGQNPLDNFIRGVQMALDPARRRKEEEERAAALEGQSELVKGAGGSIEKGAESQEHENMGEIEKTPGDDSFGLRGRLSLDSGRLDEDMGSTDDSPVLSDGGDEYPETVVSNDRASRFGNRDRASGRGTSGRGTSGGGRGDHGSRSKSVDHIREGRKTIAGTRRKSTATTGANSKEGNK
mmetsp:Transcript_64636/g.145801  ORF Transcript_64636/g.145801 Transcript_64636/m.145801 type:complete len:396 (+) Transcript_64636:516-1703(+)